VLQKVNNGGDGKDVVAMLGFVLHLLCWFYQYNGKSLGMRIRNGDGKGER
jgi:hypothetical protein